ncbi:unnamed protein product [Nippostrongylus brasiliensis]|uniref:Uncharacterized protein n=1 Tax=Nippostrongylus brasiliensis TaxID=27835 RepID=A0A0N4YD32_NIPBR|nr:unnamed protein product [Nippostrongylus brasiliensis]
MDPSSARGGSKEVRMSTCHSLIAQPHWKEFPEDLVIGDESGILHGNTHVKLFGFHAKQSHQSSRSRTLTSATICYAFGGIRKNLATAS